MPSASVREYNLLSDSARHVLLRNSLQFALFILVRANLYADLYGLIKRNEKSRVIKESYLLI